MTRFALHINKIITIGKFSKEINLKISRLINFLTVIKLKKINLAVILAEKFKFKKNFFSVLS